MHMVSEYLLRMREDRIVHMSRQNEIVFFKREARFERKKNMTGESPEMRSSENPAHVWVSRSNLLGY